MNDDTGLRSKVHLGRGLPEQAASAGEQELLLVIETELMRAGCSIPHMLLVDYYVALRTHQFVVLLGPQGQGKSELAQIVGVTLVGSRSNQATTIQTHPTKPSLNQEYSFFDGLYERFSWLKFIEFLDHAAAPENTGKPYFLCLEDLHPVDIESYFALLIQGDRAGERRLAIPGYPPARWPVVPSNLFICATLNADERTSRFSETVLGRVGVIEFRTMALAKGVREIHPINNPLIGLQRLILAPTMETDEAALVRLQLLLGLRRSELLHPSVQLATLLRMAGVAFSSREIAVIGRYVANSFDREGSGMFIPQDRLQNYRFAVDVQMSRRALLRLRCSASLETQAILEDYLDALLAGRILAD